MPSSVARLGARARLLLTVLDFGVRLQQPRVALSSSRLLLDVRFLDLDRAVRTVVSSAVSLLGSASVGHAWRTRTSSSAVTWRFGDSITGCVFLFVPVAPTAFRSRLPVDGADLFVIDRSFRLIRFSRETCRAPRGVPGNRVLPPRGASGALSPAATAAAVAASVRVGDSRQRRERIVAALFDGREPAAIAAGSRVGIRSVGTAWRAGVSPGVRGGRLGVSTAVGSVYPRACGGTRIS